MQERRHARVHEADLGAWKQRGVGWGGDSSTVLRSSHAPRTGFCRPGVPARATGHWAQACWAPAKSRRGLEGAVCPCGAPDWHCCPARRPGLLPGHQGVMPRSLPCPTSAPGKILAQRHRAAPSERAGRDQKEKCAWRESQGKTTVGRAQKPGARAAPAAARGRRGRAAAAA